MAFFASARFRMAVPPGIVGIDGAVIFPAGIPLPTLTRRKWVHFVKKYPHLQRRLLDPQLYLAGLNGATCRKACASLASYGWFGGSQVEKYDSSKHTQAEWRKKVQSKIHAQWTGDAPKGQKAIQTAIEVCCVTQVVMGCEAIILPSPLTTDPSTDYSTELMWLDDGLGISGKIGQGRPRLATIALSDTCVRGTDPWTNPLLELVLDQISARPIDGAYIVLEQANEHGYYCTHPNTIGALLRLSYGLKAAGVQRVFVAFAGVAGLLATCAGADDWTTGWYRGERRLRLADFEDEMGLANPTYYSHPVASEFHLQSDLDRVVAAKFLPRISDQTKASQGLLRALAGGANVASVADWRYSQSNVGAAIEHFLTVMARETQGLGALTPADRLDYGRQWLDRAAGLASDLYTLGGFNTRTELDHQHGWQTAYNKFLASK